MEEKNEKKYNFEQLTEKGFGNSIRLLKGIIHLTHKRKSI